MRKALFLCVCLLFLCVSAYSSVTTSDGMITLDLYEDMQSGIVNRWILGMTINDLGGGIEEKNFYIEILSVALDYDNQYNVQTTEYYEIGHNFSASIPMIEYPTIHSNPSVTTPAPVGSNFIFYGIPDPEFVFPVPYNDTFEPVMGDYYIRVNNETLLLPGPIGFAPVPEPISMTQFVFGSIVLLLACGKRKL